MMMLLLVAVLLFCTDDLLLCSIAVYPIELRVALSTEWSVRILELLTTQVGRGDRICLNCSVWEASEIGSIARSLKLLVERSSSPKIVTCTLKEDGLVKFQLFLRLFELTSGLVLSAEVVRSEIMPTSTALPGPPILTTSS